MSLYPAPNRAIVANLTEGVLRRKEELPKEVADFSIASYNVRNLFGEDEDVYSSRPSEAAPPDQLAALGRMIRDLDADAIAFQEVQHEKILAALFRQYVNPKIPDPTKRYDSFVCVPARDIRGINVALATRLAVRATLSFHDRDFGPVERRRPIRFSRDLLGVELNVSQTQRFLFFVAHLKSKIGGEKSTEKRGVEAREIRSILEEPVFGGRPYIEQPMILSGDMNDDPEAESINILSRGEGPDAIPLEDVLARIPAEKNYTYPTHNRYKKTRLDYIFASSAIEIENPEILNDENYPAAADASDHYPIIATARVEKLV